MDESGKPTFNRYGNQSLSKKAPLRFFGKNGLQIIHWELCGTVITEKSVLFLFHIVKLGETPAAASRISVHQHGVQAVRRDAAVF